MIGDSWVCIAGKKGKVKTAQQSHRELLPDSAVHFSVFQLIFVFTAHNLTVVVHSHQSHRSIFRCTRQLISFYLNALYLLPNQQKL